MKRITLLFLCLWAVLSQAQTLVNQTIVDTLSHPTQRYGYIKVLPDGAGNYVLLYNILYTGGEKENYQLIKINSSGVPVASYEFNSLHNGSDFGTNLYIKGNYAYSCGFTIDSPLGTHRINAVKLDMSRWDTVWTISESIDSITATQAPFCILVDDDESVYIAGTVQTPSSYKMTAVKYNVNGVRQWVTSYDTTGYTTVGAAMTINGDNYLAVTGTRFDNMGHSDFVTAYLDPTTGISAGQKIEKNGIGAIGSPIGIVTDMDGNNYIAGTSTVSGLASVVKLVKYDSLYNKQWAVTWGDSTQRQIAAAMSSDIGGNNFIAGTKLNANGTSDMFVVAFGADGSLLGTASVPSIKPNEGYVAKDIARDDFGGFYVTGYKYTGTDSDLVTVAFDDQAHIKWMKTFNRCAGCQESAYNVGIADDGTTILVSGKSEGSDSLYFIMRYEQWSPTACGYDTCPAISYTFKNDHITQIGLDSFVEFDVYASQNYPSLAYAGGKIVLTYNKNAFGNRIVDSGWVAVSSGVITSDTNYLFSLADTLFKSDAVTDNYEEFILNISNTNSLSRYYIADTPELLCHVKMKLKRSHPEIYGITFDRFYMQDKSYYTAEGDPAYTNVYTSSYVINSNCSVALKFKFDKLSCTQNGVEFDVVFSASYSVPIESLGFTISWNDGVYELVSSTNPGFWTSQYDANSTPNTSGDDIYVAYTAQTQSTSGGITTDHLQLQAFSNTNISSNSNNPIRYDPTDAPVANVPGAGYTPGTYTHIVLKFQPGVYTSQNANLIFDMNYSDASISIPANKFACFGTSGFTIQDFLVTTLRSNTNTQLDCDLGVNNISQQQKIIAFPNPFNNYLDVDFDGEISSNLSVTISDNIGRIIFHKQLQNSNDINHTLTINSLSNISSGIYNLTV